jgi:hypothetical protein
LKFRPAKVPVVGDGRALEVERKAGESKSQLGLKPEEGKER